MEVIEPQDPDALAGPPKPGSRLPQAGKRIHAARLLDGEIPGAAPNDSGLPSTAAISRMTGNSGAVIPLAGTAWDVQRCRCTVCDSSEYLVIDDAVPSMDTGGNGSRLWEVSYWCSQCDSYYGHTTDALPAAFILDTPALESLGSVLWRDIADTPEKPAGP